MDLVIEGRTPTADGVRTVRLGIEGQHFVDPVGAEPDIVFDDGLLLPAAIDAHVHFRDPGFPDKEDMTTGTTAAAYGGVALCCDMPNTDPPTTTKKAYAEKVKLVGEKAVIDVGLWAGIEPSLRVVELGDHVTGYKLYAGPTTGDLLVEDPDTWRRAVKAVGATGRPLAVHAEHPAKLALAELDDEPHSHERSRPAAAEVEALRVVAEAAREHGALVHACHISHPDSVPIARELGLSTEVTPHHLLLDASDVKRLGGLAKVNPPIRDHAVRDALWAAFVRGEIRCVGSDHAPHTLAEKRTSMAKAPSGVPGVETMFPLLLARAHAGQVPYERVIDACCTAPAELLGVPAGRLEPGRWASWVLVKGGPRAIEAEQLHSKCGWTPFEGHPGSFPDTLMARGRWLLREGTLTAEAGDGHFVGGPGWA